MSGYKEKVKGGWRKLRNNKLRTWSFVMNIIRMTKEIGTRNGVIGWGIMQQTWRYRVWFSMRSLKSFNWSNPSSRTVTLGLTQPLTGKGTTSLSEVGGGVQPTHRHLWTDCVENSGSSTSHNHIGLHGLLRGLLTSLNEGGWDVQGIY
jgi:hypothetical protein